MKLPLLYQALTETPYELSADGRNISKKCIFCGDSTHNRDGKHLSIKIEPDDGEPVLYQCWLAKCGKTGYLKTSDLQLLGITDLDVISELSKYNRSISKNRLTWQVHTTMRSWLMSTIVSVCTYLLQIFGCTRSSSVCMIC